MRTALLVFLPLHRLVSRRLLVAAALLALVATLLSVTTGQGVLPGDAANASTAKKKRTDGPNPVTPGDFTGYGFDQCHTPDQATMNTWLEHSPFLAVGVYISGDSRACRDQPNLDPGVGEHPARERLAPSPDHARPPGLVPAAIPPVRRRLQDQPRAGGRQVRQGTHDGPGQRTADAGRRPGAGARAGQHALVRPRGFRRLEQALSRVGARLPEWWNSVVKAAGYVAGVYSSAGSGIKVLDDARVNRPGAFTLPDQIWMARWDGVANTSTSYIREDGWRPGTGSSSFEAATTRSGVASGSTSTPTSSTSATVRSRHARATAAA